MFQRTLEYNIIFLSIEKTGRKPCSIREHIIGIVMVSERVLALLYYHDDTISGIFFGIFVVQALDILAGLF